MNVGIGINMGIGVGAGGVPAATPEPLDLGLVRFSRLEGDYLTRDVTAEMDDTTGFTFLWRGRLNANSTLTHIMFECYSAQWELYISRVNNATGNKIRVRTYVGGVANVTVDSTPTYLYTDDIETFLISGTVGGTIRIYRGSTDAEIGSGAWAADGLELSASTAINVGRESSANARSDQDIAMVLFYDTFHDISNAAVRRQFMSAVGVPVEPPAGALVDLRAPAASIATNNGSLGDFTVAGAVVNVPDPYAHDAVRFTSASSQRMARGANLTGIADAQYATFAAKIRWSAATHGSAAQRLFTGNTGQFIANKAATNIVTVTVQDSTGGSVEAASSGSIIDLDSVDGVWQTLHVAFNGNAAGGLVNAWLNGVQVVTDLPWTTHTTGTIDFSAFTNWFIGSTNTPSNYWNAEVGFIWFGAGGSTYYITDPDVFYDGGDVDLGTDGRLTGAPAPQVFYGGHQVAAGWQATNLGTGGNFTYAGTGNLTDV